MEKPKLYCFYTPSHKEFFEQYLKPSAEAEFEINEFFHEEQISQSGEYRENGWRETQYNKVLCWKRAVLENLGKFIVCCDVDIQILKPSFEELVNYAQNYDIVYQQNDLKGKICSGFFVCKCSEKMGYYFDRVAAELKAIMHEKGGGEQYVMQKILDEGNVNFNWSMFSRDMVWNPGTKYETPNELKIPNSILVHHANWVEGNENKKNQLDYVKFLDSNKDSAKDSAKDFIDEYNQNFSKFDPHKKSSIAICLSSLLRDFDIGHESFIKNVVNTLPEKPDFFGHFPIKSKTPENIKHLKNLEKFCANFCYIFEEDQVNSSYLNFNKNMNGHQRNGILGNLYQWNSMQAAKNLKVKYEEKFDFNYDYVIWSRPDLYYFNTFDNILNLNSNFNLFFPAHDNHFCGIHDRFCVGRSKEVNQRLDIIDYFTEEWYPRYHNDERYLFFNPVSRSYQWNPELVLSQYINDFLNIEYSKINLCSGKIRPNGFVRIPFWYEVQGAGNSKDVIDCEEDIINVEVMRKIYANDNIRVQSTGAWFDIKL